MSTIGKLNELAARKRPSQPHQWLIEPKLVVDAARDLEVQQTEIVELQAILESVRIMCATEDDRLARNVEQLITTVDNSALLEHDARLRQEWADARA